MGTRQATMDHLLDQIREAGAVTTRRMFGEFCVYLDGTPVALVCNDQLYVKQTSAGRALMPRAEEGQPFPGAKPWLFIPTDDWERREPLRDLLRATRDELPPPRPRAPRPARRPRRA